MSISDSEAEKELRVRLAPVIKHIAEDFSNALTGKFFKELPQKQAQDFLIQNFAKFQPQGDVSPLRLTQDQFSVLRDIVFSQSRRSFLKKTAYAVSATTLLNHLSRRDHMSDFEKEVNEAAFMLSTPVSIHISKDDFNKQLEQLLVRGGLPLKQFLGKEVDNQKFALNVEKTLEPLLQDLSKQILRDEGEIKRTL